MIHTRRERSVQPFPGAQEPCLSHNERHAVKLDAAGRRKLSALGRLIGLEVADS